MSSTMETHMLLTRDEIEKRLTWRDLAILAWKQKANQCKFEFTVCSECKYESCPFVLFMSD
jgi:hypothetical protein